MKKFKVEIAKAENFSAEQIWDTFQEPFEAESAEEAEELAKQYLIDCGMSEEETAEYHFKVVEIND